MKQIAAILVLALALVGLGRAQVAQSTPSPTPTPGESSESSPSPTPTPGESADEPVIPERSRQHNTREAFGLPLDEPRVESAEARARERGNPFHPFGVPLTEAEEGELEFRTELQGHVPPVLDVAAEDETETAGVWMHHDSDERGYVTLGLKSGADRGEYERRLEGFPYPERLRIQTVGFSTDELRAIRDALFQDADRLRSEGVGITGISIRPQDNAVVAGVKDLNEEKRSRVHSRHPDVTVISGEHQPPGDDRRNSPGPLKGGIRLTAPIGFGVRCSGNFAYRSVSGQIYHGLAGHCNGNRMTNTGWDGTGTLWSHNYPANWPLAINTNGHLTRSDAGFLAVPSWMDSNIVILTGTQGLRLTGTLRSDFPGMTVCRSGDTTGYWCGTIVTTDFIWFVDFNGDGLIDYVKTNMRISSQGTALGDSGGSYTTSQSSPSPGVVEGLATGVHGGGGSEQSIYSNIGWVEDESGLQVVTGAQVHEFRIRHSGQCMDIAGGSLADQALVVQYTCHGGTNQRFFIQPVEGYYHLRASNSGRCVDIEGESQWDGANYWQLGCRMQNVAWSQLFSLYHMGGLEFLIVNRHSNRCADVTGGSQSPGTQVIQWGCHGGLSQVWRIGP